MYGVLRIIKFITGRGGGGQNVESYLRFFIPALSSDHFVYVLRSAGHGSK